MNNDQLYIIHDSIKYPVHFTKSKDSWIWKQNNWMNLYIPKPEFIEYANDITNQLHKLEKLTGHEYLRKEIAEYYAKELEASWEIEGENLDSYILRSALVNKLGLNVPEWSLHREYVRSDRENAALDGSLFLLNHKGPLTLELLCKTHQIIGKVEEDPVKKPYYRQLRKCEEFVGKLDKAQSVYLAAYEGPAYKNVPALMQNYFTWWQNSHITYPIPIGAALAHLYFVVIHPFHDGNGRMARLLTDKYFAVSDEASFRPVNIGATIRTHRTDTQSTLLQESAETGASEGVIRGSKLCEDMDDLPNYQREPLLPYICISTEIIGKKSEYYNSLAKASADRNLDDFIITMLNFQNNAIEGALARVPKLQQLHKFFQIVQNRLSPEEKLVIRNAFLSDERMATMDTCLADITDEAKAEQIWKHLHDLGLLNAFNKANLDISLLPDSSGTARTAK